MRRLLAMKAIGLHRWWTAYRRLGWTAVRDLPDCSIALDKHYATRNVNKMNKDEVYIDQHVVCSRR